MIYSSFLQNKHEAGEDLSRLNDIGNGPASHPLNPSSFTTSFNKLLYGNIGRDKKKDVGFYILFSSRYFNLKRFCSAFPSPMFLSLPSYNRSVGCTHMSFTLPPKFCGILDASSHLSLTYKDVCRKLFKGFKKGFGVLASKVKSVYVMLCYVITISFYSLSLLLNVIAYKLYDIPYSMLCYSGG